VCNPFFKYIIMYVCRIALNQDFHGEGCRRRVLNCCAVLKSLKNHPSTKMNCFCNEQICQGCSGFKRYRNSPLSIGFAYLHKSEAWIFENKSPIYLSIGSTSLKLWILDFPTKHFSVDLIT
jgi:hypothetical protein